MNFAPFTSEEVAKIRRVAAGPTALGGVGMIVGAAFNGWSPPMLLWGGAALIAALLSWYFDD